jgi:hypothetical protein
VVVVVVVLELGLALHKFLAMEQVDLLQSLWNLVHLFNQAPILFLRVLHH